MRLAASELGHVAAVAGQKVFDWGPVKRPGLMWPARALFLGGLLVLFGGLLVPAHDDTVGRGILALSFVCLLVGFLFALLARRDPQAPPTRRTPSETRRHRLRTGAAVLMIGDMASLVAIPLLPLTGRIIALQLGLVMLVGSITLFVVSQPSREEAGATDYSKPSPRGRVGLWILGMLVLMFAFQLVQHAL